MFLMASRINLASESATRAVESINLQWPGNRCAEKKQVRGKVFVIDFDFVDVETT